MTKLLYIFLVAFVCVSASAKKEKGSEPNTSKVCTQSSVSASTKWVDMADTCIKELKKQVNREVNAALIYLDMAAYFARDEINRPGFSKFFFEAANEERQHAIKIIEYLLMRGQLTEPIGNILTLPSRLEVQEWRSGSAALQYALNSMEANITTHIHNITRSCEVDESRKPTFTDYHLIDYLTTDFLTEQYEGERDLAGKISVLDRMTLTYQSFGEFLFDKKLLNGEV